MLFAERYPYRIDRLVLSATTAYPDIETYLEENEEYRRRLPRSPRPADPERALRDLKRPILILHGARELGFPVQVAHRLHAALPDSELALIEDAGHAAHFEKRAAWVARLRAFLAGHDHPELVAP